MTQADTFDQTLSGRTYSTADGLIANACRQAGCADRGCHLVEVPDYTHRHVVLMHNGPSGEEGSVVDVSQLLLSAYPWTSPLPEAIYRLLFYDHGRWDVAEWNRGYYGENGRGHA